MIHQDINPSNILFDEFLFPKLSDFCYAYIRERCLGEDFNIIIPGNPEYLAPDIFDDNEEASSCCDGRKSDIYSFAIVMYVIMTGDKPYNNFMKPIGIINYVKNDHKRPVFNKPIPDCYRDLIEKCWSENPDDRPSGEDIVDILKTNTSFLTEKVDKEKYFNYIKYIESMKTKPFYDNQLNMPVFPKRDFQTDLFQKVDIYDN
ncbi:hypothetical protein M9Y10_028304 [Tritrichomonas musculus]|uniref:Protein kinase domain-containing protein n=1 Tax=Tritrichomonas musculus TaxID=1915356 RepID=A0ABR2KIY6_9EUKA